jgi:hypothetical protein
VSADLTLLRKYATGQFIAATDGHGGTLTGDPPLAATDNNPKVLMVPSGMWLEFGRAYSRVT